MTIEELKAKEETARKEFESKTVAFQVHGENVTIAQARAMFDKYHTADSWKSPVNTVVPYADLAIFVECVKFYQGCNPIVNVARRGTVCDPGYRVTSPGYVC